MTHDELLAKIEENDDNINFYALRAVVELHPMCERGSNFLNDNNERYTVSIYMCGECDLPYPCPTIQAIEKELK